MYFICNALFIQKNLRVPSLCPSPFNCITRNIKRHLPYSTFFSLHLSLYPSHSTFSQTPSLCFTPFSLLLSIFSLFTLSLLSCRATLVHSPFFSSLCSSHPLSVCFSLLLSVPLIHSQYVSLSFSLFL